MVKKDKDDVLWVCWKKPDSLPENCRVILSFMSPAVEFNMEKEFRGKLFSGRKLSVEIRKKAVKIYVDLVAKIGIVSPKDYGKTLRETLKIKDNFSLWWFHKVSNKDCDKDPTFHFIVETLTIHSVACSLGISKVVLFGGHKELGVVLQNVFEIIPVNCENIYGFLYVFVRGMFSRAKYFFIFLWQWFFIKMNVKLPEGKFDIVFSNFWDFGVKEDEHYGNIADRYFKSLPAVLALKGFKIGWFLWVDPYYSPLSKKLNLNNFLRPINKHNNLVALQYFIRLSDLFKAIVDFRAYGVFLSFCRRKEFKDIFVIDGLNLYPLFKGVLHLGFLNCTIPHFELVYSGSLRAFKKYQPKISLSFLELFLHSRAFYAAAKNVSSGIINCVIQHASYSREKTFAILDPEIEYKGYPDNCPIPKPDYLFAMGELGRDIFSESGFPEDRIFLTGSSRYDYIRENAFIKGGKSNAFRNILIVPSINTNLEMDMIEALFEAIKDLLSARLFLRNHPFAKIENHPKFHLYKEKIQITRTTLEHDLEETDLVIFSYSTVAEEALIKGIPVWQWLPISYNGSVFRDLKVIPSFYSVSELRKSLREFIDNPDLFKPSKDIINRVFKKCFYVAGETVCVNIVKHLIDLINPKQPRYVNDIN